MAMDRITRILTITFTLALLLNGLNPWLLPPNARANEDTLPVPVMEKTAECEATSESSSQIQKENGNLRRRLISMEGSLNDIKLTLSGIDRKINQLSSRYPKESR